METVAPHAGAWIETILEITTCRCRDWGRDVPVIDQNTAVFTFVVAGAVGMVLAAFEFFRGKVWRGKARQCVARNGAARRSSARQGNSIGA